MSENKDDTKSSEPNSISSPSKALPESASSSNTVSMSSSAEPESTSIEGNEIFNSMCYSQESRFK